MHAAFRTANSFLLSLLIQYPHRDRPDCGKFT